MNILCIEINDVGLIAAAAAGPLGPPSPGYALLRRHELVVGEAARAVARREPRLVSHLHWDRLSLEPVGRPFPRGATHADLVYAHLSRFWGDLLASFEQPSATVSVLLAVPGHYSGDQLALLLGVARACGMPVDGLVDAALAAVADGDDLGTATLLHLDLHQHRALWSVVERGDGAAARRRVESVEAAGLLRLQQAWARVIAERFVRRTRFDPLHDGASEQALYDRLPDWLREVGTTGGALLSLADGESAPSIEIAAAQLAAATRAPLDALVAAARRLGAAPGGAAIALSARAATVPGLAVSLQEATGAPVVRLPEGAAAIGAFSRREQIASPGDELPLVVALPALEIRA